MNRILSVLVQDNLILGGQRSDKDENGIPDYNDGGSDMDLLMLSAGILDVLEALPYTRATFGTCVGSSLCQCNLHLSADYVDQVWLLAYMYVCVWMSQNCYAENKSVVHFRDTSDLVQFSQSTCKQVVPGGGLPLAFASYMK